MLVSDAGRSGESFPLKGKRVDAPGVDEDGGGSGEAPCMGGRGLTTAKLLFGETADGDLGDNVEDFRSSSLCASNALIRFRTLMFGSKEKPILHGSVTPLATQRIDHPIKEPQRGDE